MSASGGGPPGGSQQDLTAVTRCLQGSTVIVTLTDPSKHNLWTANLGDSQTGMYVCDPFDPFFFLLFVSISRLVKTLIFYFIFTYQFLRLVHPWGAGAQRLRRRPMMVITGLKS